MNRKGLPRDQSDATSPTRHDRRNNCGVVIGAEKRLSWPTLRRMILLGCTMMKENLSDTPAMHSSTATSQFRRHGLGISGVLLLIIGICLWCWPPASASMSFAHGSCIKAGLVLSAAWLAFPKLDQMPVIVFGSMLAVLLFVALRPALLPALVRIAMLLSPILILIWMLRAKPKRK